MADAVVITKADGENEKRARLAQVEFQQALHLFQSSESGWTPKVLVASSTEKRGIDEVWRLIENYFVFATKNNLLFKNREQQNIRWFHESVDQQFRNKILQTRKGSAKLQTFEKKIKAGKIIPSHAATEVVKSLLPRR
jgi:LAO/AO transport system kinase